MMEGNFVVEQYKWILGEYEEMKSILLGFMNSLKLNIINGNA